MKAPYYFGQPQEGQDMGIGAGTPVPDAPVWPDIDLEDLTDPDNEGDADEDAEERDYGFRKERVVTAFNGRAVALNANTDWDAVNVYFDAETVPVMLLPGVLIRRSFDRLRAEPIVRCPATRLGPRPNTPMSPIWLGKLALDVWQDEEPPCDYVARLPAIRVVHFDEQQLAAEQEEGVPDQQLIVVPSLNVRSAQFTFESSGPGDIDVAIGSPLPDELLNVAAKVRSDVATAVNGDGAADAVFESIHPFLSVIAGATLDNTIMKAGAMLILKRENVG